MKKKGKRERGEVLGRKFCDRGGEEKPSSWFDRRMGKKTRQ